MLFSHKMYEIWQLLGMNVHTSCLSFHLNISHKGKFKKTLRKQQYHSKLALNISFMQQKKRPKEKD
jgi:hypothetical protein